MGNIYLITNTVNGKMYVGQTIHSIEKRFSEHLYAAEAQVSAAGKVPLAYAIRKYGREVFEIELLERCTDSEMDNREIYWVSYYDTFRSENGYNATAGGSRGAKKDLDLELVESLYRELKSARKVAKRMSVDKDCIVSRLKFLGVEILTRADQVPAVHIYKNEEDHIPFKIFKTKRETAEWFLSQGIPRSKNIESIRKGIIHNTVYYNYFIKVETPN